MSTVFLISVPSNAVAKENANDEIGAIAFLSVNFDLPIRVVEKCDRSHHDQDD